MYGHWIPGRGRDGLEKAILGEVVGQNPKENVYQMDTYKKPIENMLN